MAYFTFSSPLYLNFLFAIPAIIFVHVWTIKGRHKRAIKFANIEAIERISGADIFSKNLTSMFIQILLVTAVTLSLAGTVFHVEKMASSFSYVVAVDASSSMSAVDIPPSRIFAAKQAAKDFVDLVPLSTRVGIVSFSGVSYVEQDMTDDKRILKDAIEAVNLKAIGGTNVLDAVITSVNLMKDEGARAVLLLSDGQLNVNSAQEIIDYAQKKNVVIHTIGIGTIGGGNAESFVSKLDEEALKAMAYNTNGKYYPIADRAGLTSAFGDIAVSTNSIVGINLSVYLLIGVLITLVLQWILVNTRWRIIP